jgi:hypothetical protein
LGRHGAEVLAPKYHEEAIQRAKELAPIIRELRGYSLSRIAAEPVRYVPLTDIAVWLPASPYMTVM